MSGRLDEYEAAARREIDRHPGAVLSFHEASRHGYALVGFGGSERKVFHPNSPSDGRGPMRFAADIRAVLRGLGAARPPLPKGGKHHRRNPAASSLSRDLEPGPPTHLAADPWAPLAALRTRLEAHA